MLYRPPRVKIDHSKVRLGRRPARHDMRTLRMGSYLTLPSIPKHRDWTSNVKTPWGMMLNDQYGCCTIAGIGHYFQSVTAANGNEVTLPDSAILQGYQDFCNFNPADPSTDQCGIEIDVLNGIRQRGLAGHKIDAYVACEPKNHFHFMAAIELFGGCYLGFSLPNTAQGQNQWEVPAGNGPETQPGSWGGHAVIALAFDQNWIKVISWGDIYLVSWSFVDKYCEEAYALLSHEWAPLNRLAPSGFDYPTLLTDLRAVA